MTTIYPLHQLGWSPFFQQQLSLEEFIDCSPARVIAQHRSYAEIYTDKGRTQLPYTSQMPPITTGDWVLLDGQGVFRRLLERRSCFSRKASGPAVSEQLVAANIDTVFIVAAMNDDFSLNRIERYLVLTKEAGADAVVVLTKKDLCEDYVMFLNLVQALSPSLVVEAVNSLDVNSAICLKPWCRPGSTVALLGSSGVGKSTLINTLLGQAVQNTAEARESDSKGRHTTTSRTLHFLNDGGVLLDTPGMRELQMVESETGLKETFAEIADLEAKCRFSDCQHKSEPGCAVQAAIINLQLDPRRLANYQKLKREQAINAETLAIKRAKARSFSQHVRAVKKEVEHRKKDWK